MNIKDLYAKAEAQRTGYTSGTYKGAIDYMGEKIAQYHNPNLMVDDILGENETKQFTALMIIGTPGSGKSTAKNFIAHEIHTRDPSYLVFNFGRKELQDFDNVMKKLPNRNLVLSFDDVSLALRKMKDPEKKDRILQTLTEARHPQFEDTDRKVIIITNVHYQNSLEKMWRSQGGWKIYTDMTDEEAQVFNALTKGRYKKKVNIFAQTVLKQFRKKEYTISLTNNQKATYVVGGHTQDNKQSTMYGKKGVFRFILCYDTASIRFFLIPNVACNLCDPKKDRVQQIKVTPREIIYLMVKYYGKHGKAGLKLALNEIGEFQQFPNRTINAKRIATEIFSTFDFDPKLLSLTMRKDARIKTSAMWSSRKKKIEFFEDIQDLRTNEGKSTFASTLSNDTKGELDLDQDEEIDNSDL